MEKPDNVKEFLENVKRKLEWYPTLSVLLAILITVIFLSQTREAVQRYGLFWGFVPGEPWRLVTCHFIHSGKEHFLMNALGIIVLGGLLELTGVKRKHILLGMVMAMITADITTLGVQMVKPSIVVGSSGIIYGFVGMLISIVGWGGMIALGAVFFGYGPLLLGQNIAGSAHIGGFLGGLIIGKLI